MGIPSNFSHKGLAGFHVSSSKLVAVEQQYQNAEGGYIVSPKGKCFVRIDNPRAANSDGLRQPDADNAAYSLTEEKNWLPRIHPDGTLTHGGKGAWLECRNILIPENKCLWFRYAFLRFASLPTNTFAALLFFPNDDTSAAPLLPPHWICCVKDLQQDRGGIYQTDWTEDSVRIDYDGDFQGTVRWIVSTGHSVTDRGAIPNNTRFARPGCLLIDAIDIR
ncbi:hypothetical protein [uncultured Nitrosomonas sp.]|uniref:hypothetical protein n=1 Tax=uncultured Nitrosomonas sp. TaxID=156424 RepID=UPI0025E7D781|nr:hypothetical protein [uncultured Nitrosomonas sp.]